MQNLQVQVLDFIVNVDEIKIKIVHFRIEKIFRKQV